MQRVIDASHTTVRRRIHISTELNVWLEMLDRCEQLIRCRQHFETEIAVGKENFHLVKQTLYPYQQEGMLHLAFTGRAAFLERIDSLMSVETQEPQTAPADLFDRLRDDVLSRWSSQLELMELHGEGNQRTLLVVVDRLSDAMQSALARQLHDRFPDQTPKLQLLNRETFATIQELIMAGVLSANQDTGRTLYRATAEDEPKVAEQLKRLNEARSHLAQSTHRRRMAKVLRDAERLHRLHDDKIEVCIHDYADFNEPMLARMFDRRCKGDTRRLVTRFNYLQVRYRVGRQMYLCRLSMPGKETIPLQSSV